MAKDELIAKHVLVPKHSKLGENKVKELLDKYNISKIQLPKITIKDPAIAHLNSKIGDVIKIERKSLTSGNSIYYRVVTED